MLREWTRADTIAVLPVPTAHDDKYSRGVVALRTGSATYPGAAVLGVEAAWRTGAGYVRYVGDAVQAVLARRPETVAGEDLGSTRVGAWVIGSGTDAAHRSEHEQRALQRILDGSTPVVVDAGALDLADGAAAPLVLTPHAGELRRLRDQLGLPATDLTTEHDRVAAVIETADRVGATVLLKGARTLIATPGQIPIVVDNAPHWLATAGTGDVLAGILAALLAACGTAPPHETAAAGVWLHGHAAALASGSVGGAAGHPIVALDVAEALPRAVGELLS
ncbi:NAD(P)H-hydrate dehydratase [Microbacterium esteraromaticum]|uniref:ADP-dependent (S)-NAD(P)H-hydrate dehydratase n=1 Tax=Microbacterium esteraromaticum TaxID=57043 RepID=A0A939DWX7_9MICO|nr:ADP/ATP-dependent (S)-NAD(P)H-hydrate dehydratase [Microbacterium esteraromaticum]MBN8205757.1 NAD(P)H-hydrate dehydratase [Microbacterium esteraromaticum]MBN8415911.1 NAD(P)H-hydrate dehydratase [Microbacterium esteraromaticum]